MVNYFLSENLKIKNTFIKRLVYIAPIFVFVLSIFLATDYYIVDGYNWWYMTIIPIFLVIECTSLASLDDRYKNSGILSLPLDLKKVWIAKIFVILKNFIISNLILFFFTNIVSFIIPLNSVIKIPFINGLLGILVLVITFMWQIPIWLYLGQKFGKFICIILSVLTNILFQVLAIKEYWFMIPFSYPARLMCPILKILPNGLLAVPESETFSPELLSTSSVFYGIIVSIILFIIFTILTSKLFSKTESIK
ncbi:MAG TPA: lantibiotic immunity ABC transporter MutE/EpiE family permease subunit [Clostridium sp.]|nr:lantibiotic immunity ABC transporter MutE/EpiE family permease subunit [Clostridium sp.]